MLILLTTGLYASPLHLPKIKSLTVIISYQRYKTCGLEKRRWIKGAAGLHLF